MAEQLWKGRFSKAVDSRVNDFNSSIRFDQRMIAQDMRGSGVHATMLAKQGIISEQDCEDILNGLASIADDLASGKLEIDPNAEDVHTFVEQTLTARIGDAGKRLHTGRSRNDQVALDIRLTLRDYSHTLQAYIVELVKVICKKAAENTVDELTGEQLTFENVVVCFADMDAYAGDSHDVQEVQYIKGGDAYLFTRGGVQVGRWEKTYPTNPLKLYTKSGEEMTLNRGKTYFALVDNDELNNFSCQ